MKSAAYPETSGSGRTTTMRAAVIVAPQTLEIQDAEIPEPSENQIRVKIEGCGVCASNIPPWEGREWFSYPMAPGALGHEAWGWVDKVGSKVEGFQTGDRVAMLSGHAYAEYDLADEGAIIHLPSELDGKPFPAEPLGCAMNIFRRSEINSGDTVAIVGIGFLGSLLTHLATDAGAKVIALARKQSSLDMARRMGAQETVLMDDHWRAIEAVKNLTDGKFCEVVIEATGKQWPLDLAAELTKERGRLIIAGYHQDGLRQVNMQMWNWRGLAVINAHERDPQVYLQGMQSAVQAVISGKLQPEPLYTHTFDLSDLDRALDFTRDRPEGFFKALISMEK